MNYRNEEIWNRMTAVLPGFKWETKEGQKCPHFVNWPTIGASLGPLRAGRNASLREIEVFLDAAENGEEPIVSLDHPELTKQVQREIRNRRRENKISRKRHSFARSEHGYLF